MLASGNLGLVSFPDVHHRMSKEEMDARHPALLTTLANHPGVGFLLVRSEEYGGVVLGPFGTEIPLEQLDETPGPLADFGPGRPMSCAGPTPFRTPPTSWSTPGTTRRRGGARLRGADRVARRAGGAQAKPFLLSPLALSEPPEDITGAEQVHRVLRGWLDEAGGPQVPLGKAEEKAA